MKRSHLTLVAAAAVLAVGASPALAKPKAKAAPTPKPVTTTYFFHSVNNSGTGNGNVNGLVGDAKGILPMDATKPTGTTDQDYGTFGAASNPNHSCYGNPLTQHPSWRGSAVGTLTGKLTVEFYARSTPGKAVVQLFRDVPDEQQCNDAFPAVEAETTVDLPSSPGFTKVTAVLTLSKPLVVKQGFSLMFTTESAATPQATDIGFDSTTSPSGVTWTCLPNAGKKTC